MQRLRTDEVGTGDPGFRLRLGRLIDCRGAWDPQGNGPATDRDRRVPSAPSPQGGARETTGESLRRHRGPGGDTGTGEPEPAMTSTIRRPGSLCATPWWPRGRTCPERAMSCDEGRGPVFPETGEASRERRRVACREPDPVWLPLRSGVRVETHRSAVGVRSGRDRTPGRPRSRCGGDSGGPWGSLRLPAVYFQLQS